MRGCLVLAMALFFAFWQNAYFGHNAFPRSDAELMADGVVLLLTALGVLCWSIDAKR
jgi:hypothetical protein